MDIHPGTEAPSDNDLDALGTALASGSRPERRRPGPVYDAAMRGVLGGDPLAACRLLGIPVDAAPQVLPSTFPTLTLTTDLLLRVAPGRLAHVEFTDRAKKDLVTRMLGYRWVVMRDHPDDHVTQHVIVLGGGRVEGHDQPAVRGFSLELNVVYLRDVPPAVLLGDVALAPLASLGRGSPRERAEACLEALSLIQNQGGARREDLLNFATALAGLHLNGPMIEQLTQIVEEAGMVVDAKFAEAVRGTIFGQALLLDAERQAERRVEEAERRAEEAGRRAEEKGRERVVALLLDLLDERFGADPRCEAVAEHLATWSSGAVHAVTVATSLDELENAQPPA